MIVEEVCFWIGSRLCSLFLSTNLKVSFLSRERSEARFRYLSIPTDQKEFLSLQIQLFSYISSKDTNRQKHSIKQFQLVTYESQKIGSFLEQLS